VLCGVASRITSDIVDYKQPGFADVPGYLKQVWANSLLGLALLGIYLLVVSVAFPFYAGKGVIGWLAMGLLFWVTVAALLVLSSSSSRSKLTIILRKAGRMKPGLLGVSLPSRERARDRMSRSSS
jgi:hypothetical protein